MTTDRRVLIVGGGVVGLACAELLASGGVQVVLLERCGRTGEGTSSRNSEVIHAGIYYPQGSAKAALCVEGRRRLLAFCRHEGVGHRLVGKLIVATRDDEVGGLDLLETRALAAAVDPPLERWSAAQVARRAPAVRATAALWSAGTGIVDVHCLMDRLRARAEAAGALILTHHRVVGATPSKGAHEVQVLQPDGGLQSHIFEAVINAAGHGAAPLARAAGFKTPEVFPLKGSYFSIRGPAPADCLVYPAPQEPLISLGVHLTIDLAGRARLGPDHGPALSPDDLKVEPGRAVAFHEAARRYLPGLRLNDLQPDYAGVRPKLMGDGFADFCIRPRSEEGLPAWIDLLGIDSPGLTAALAIAHRVAELLELV